MSIRGLFSLESRRSLKSRCLLATFGALVFVFNASDGALFAQRSNVERNEAGEVSASSILSGNRFSKGATSGVDRSRSRFSNGAVYGTAGNIAGIEGSGASRFSSKGSKSFKSKLDYSLLRQRVAYEKAPAEAESSDAASSGSPRRVVATKPPRVPYASNRRARYGVREGELAEKARIQTDKSIDKTTSRENAVAREETFREALEAQNMASPRNMTPQNIWMRGRQPNLGSVRADSDRWGDDYDVPYELPYVDGDAPFYGDSALYDDGLGGNLRLDESLFETSLPTRAPVVQTPTPAETRQAFQGYLEAQLLRRPSVNPLSPIQVDFNDGVAVVRGVVPTPSARVAAGNILLADPRVKKVDNKLTFMRPDDPSLTSPIQSTTGGTNVKTN